MVIEEMYVCSAFFNNKDGLVSGFPQWNTWALKSFQWNKVDQFINMQVERQGQQIAPILGDS